MNPISVRLQLFLAAAALMALSCGTGRDVAYKRHFFALDTFVDITLYSSRDPRPLLDSVQAIIVQADSLFSISNPASDIWKVNHRTGPRVRVRPVTARILSFCAAECDSSGGLFDITVAPLKYLYGLESHQRENHVPGAAELNVARQYIGCHRMRLEGDSLLAIDSGVTIDAGGIAKGYLLGRVKDFLLRAGQGDFLVNLGGDLIAWGLKPQGKQWIVGVQHPRIDSLLVATMAVSNTCVFSSGDYERYFIKDGIRYHHLFDPHTAGPGRKNRATTVVGPDPMLADVCVKEAFFMDAPQALEFLKRRSLAGVVIDSVGGVWASVSLENMLRPDRATTVRYQ